MKKRAKSMKLRNLVMQLEIDLQGASLIIDDRSSESDSDISLGQEVLSLFGKNVVQSSSLNPPILKDLSEIWTGILNKGLGDEKRQELIRKFPHPENCTTLAPPKLNPLVVRAASGSVIRRDKRLCDIQAQISAAIAAIGLSVTNLLKRKEEQYVGAIQQLGEAGRLLTDLFHQETLSRRELAAMNLNRSLKDTLLDAPNDDWLFGKDLEDRVRSHKTLAQSSKQLKEEKLPPIRAASSSFPKRPLNAKSSPRKSQGLRRGGRQQYQQPRRDYRTRDVRDKGFRRPEKQGQRTRYQQSVDRHPRKHTRSLVVTENKETEKLYRCLMCKGSHFIQTCSEFLNIPVAKRAEKVMSLRLCLNCLRGGHISKFCRRPICKRCNSKHHSLLHIDKIDSSKQEVNNEPTENTAHGEVATVHSACSEVSDVLLSTAHIGVIGRNGKRYTLRALLDSGAQSSFITESACNLLGIVKERVNESVKGINGVYSNIMYKCNVDVFSINSDFTKTLYYFVVCVNLK
nr:unnamed protein product [Callosobruchus analis]